MHAAPRRRTWRRAVAGVVAAVVAVCVLTFVGAPAAQSSTATGGTGRYLPTINWFEWGANGASITSGTTRTNRIAVGGQELAITCTISDLQGTGGLAAYRPGTWTGDGLDDMYNIGGTGTANQMTIGLRGGVAGNANFDLDCSATFDGDPIDLAGMVIADAEQSATEEYVGATAPAGATWRVIDRYRAPGCAFTTLGFRQGGRLDLHSTMNTSCPAGPTAVAFLEDATSLDDVTVRGEGVSAIAVGVVMTLDFGDAPASYDVAGAVSQFRYTGGTIPESTGVWNIRTNPGVDLFGQGFSLASPVAPHVRLGSSTDIETAQPFSSDALGDDRAGQTLWGGPDDETLAVPATASVVPGGTVTVPIACSGSAPLAGWLDWNRNGTFDAAERSAVGRCATDASLTWDVPADIPADGATYPTFVRIRTGKDAAASPIGFTPDGEVEDHRLAFTTPVPDAVDDTAATPARTPVAIPVLANDDAGAGATMLPATVVFTSPAATEGGRRLAVPGEGAWTIDAATGTVTFTPEDGFRGRVTPVEYRASNSTAAGALGATALIGVTVGAASAAADDAATTPQNVDVVIDPLRNDRAGDDGTGAEGALDARSVVFTSGAATAAGRRLEVAGEGVWAIDADTGTIRFDPDPDFRGAATPVVYSVRDSFGNASTAEVTVEVTPVTPRAVDDAALVAIDTPLTFDIVANDDPGAPSAPLDRSTVVFTSSSATDGGRALVVPGQGTFAISPTTGDVTFTPVEGFSGAVDPVTYRVGDANGTTTDAVIRVRVVDPPTANPDTLVTTQNVTATVDPLANDGAGRGGSFDRTSVLFESPDATDGGRRLEIPDQGTWSIDPVTGLATFDPRPGFVGSTTPVAYRATTMTGTSATSTLSVRVSAVTPVAEPDAVRTPFRTAVTAAVLDNDRPGAPAAPLDRGSVILTGPDAIDGGAALVVAGQGRYDVTAAGAISFTPAPGFTGTATPVTYRVLDANGTPATATLTVAVDLPAAAEAIADSAVTTQDVDITVDVVSNDRRPDGNAVDPASVVFDSAAATDGGRRLVVPDEGTYSISPTTGAVTFDPLPAFTGTTSPVTYRITDGFGRTSTAPVTVTVRSVDPDARDDAARTGYRTPVTVRVLGNDLVGASDAALVPSSVRLTSPQATDDGRRLAVRGEGVWTVDAATGDVTFAPAVGFAGPATPAEYRVSDTVGAGDTAAIRIFVDAPAPPTTRPDTATTAQNVTVTVNPLANDSSSTREPLAGNRVHFTATAAAENGRRLVVDGEGVYTIDALTGAIAFDPEPTFHGTATPVGYEVSDSFGSLATSTVTVTVLAVTPVAVDDTGTTAHDTPVAVDVPGNDRAGAATAALDRRSVVLVDPAATDGGRRLVVAGQGTYVVDAATGTMTFTPLPTFAGTAAPARYRIADVNGTTTTATLTVTVSRPAAPVARADEATTPQNVTVTVDPVANDAGAALDLSSVAFTDPTASGGGKTLAVPGEGIWRVAAEGRVVFDPEPAFTGRAEPVAYRVRDAFGQESSATITVIVTAVTPAANDDRTTTAFGRPATIDVVANDRAGAGTAPLAPSTVVLTDPAATNAGRRLVAPGQGVWTADPQTGVVTFAPAEGFVGETTPVAYSVADGNGSRATALMRVTVGLPDAPVAVSDTATTPYDATVSIDLLGNDDVPAGSALAPTTARFTTQGASADGRSLVVPGEGTWTLDAAGTAIFDPEPGFAGAATAVAYRVSDRYGQSSTAQISVTVRPPAPPAPADDARGTLQGTAVVLRPLDNDTAAPGSPLVVGSLAFTSALAADAGTRLAVPGEGVYTIDPRTGEVSFEPEPAFRGAATPVEYRVSDRHGQSGTAVIAITVAAVAPVARDDDATTRNAQPVVIEVLANDVAGADAAPIEPSSVRFTSTQATDDRRTLDIPAQGVWRIDPVTGAVEFTPAPGFDGTAAVEYSVADTHGTRASATVRVVVGPAPSARSDIVTASFGPVTIDPLGNDLTTQGVSLDRRTLRLSLLGMPVGAELGDDGRVLVVPSQGRWVVNEDGTVTFTPVAGFSGSTTPVTYTAQDGVGNVVSATMSVTLSAAPPTGGDDPQGLAGTGAESTGLLLTGLALLILGALAFFVRRRSRRGRGGP